MQERSGSKENKARKYFLKAIGILIVAGISVVVINEALALSSV